MIDWALVISALAFAASLVSLWKSYISPFKLRVSFEAPTFSLYKITPEISGGDSSWWIPSFDLGFTFYNVGSQTGEVSDVRLLATLKTKEGDKVYPFYPKWIVDYPSFNKEGWNRMKWLNTSVTREWYPIFLAGNAQQSVHLVLEGFRWDKKMTGELELKLQMFSSAEESWTDLASFSLQIFEDYYDDKSKHTLSDPNLARIRKGEDNWHDEIRKKENDPTIKPTLQVHKFRK